MRNEETALPSGAVAAAAGTAAAGAGLWAFVMLQFEFEYAMIAWGIGAAVGAVFHRLGGRGVAGAVLCAGLTVGAIGFGKYVAVDRFLGEQQQVMQTLAGGPETYAQIKAQADAYRQATTDEELLALMQEQGWSTDDASVEAYRENMVPLLESLPPTYEAYKAEMAESMEFDRMEILLESLGAWDLLFFGLAVFTAWQLARGRMRAAGAVAAAEPYRTRPRREKVAADNPW